MYPYHIVFEKYTHAERYIRMYNLRVYSGENRQYFLFPFVSGLWGLGGWQGLRGKGKVIGYYTPLPCGLSRVRASLARSCIVRPRTHDIICTCILHDDAPAGIPPLLSSALLLLRASFVPPFGIYARREEKER